MTRDATREFPAQRVSQVAVVLDAGPHQPAHHPLTGVTYRIRKSRRQSGGVIPQAGLLQPQAATVHFEPDGVIGFDDCAVPPLTVHTHPSPLG